MPAVQMSSNALWPAPAMTHWYVGVGAARNVAFVPAGDPQAEKPFNQQGEDTTVVRADGRPGRRGTKWFSYDVPLDPAAALLVVTYNSDNVRTATNNTPATQSAPAPTAPAAPATPAPKQ